jgi:DNA-binding NarL/FixJ family response regulator
MRVAVAEDSVLLREGLVGLLSNAGFQVVGSCGDAAQLLACVEEAEPDVVVVDVRMPPTYTDEGLRAAREVRTRSPGTGVLVLSQYVEVKLASELLARGVDGVGYLLKDRITDVGEFAVAVRQVGAGGSVLDPAVVSQLLARREHTEAMRRLTGREREVLARMAEGRSNQAIARELTVSLRAVEKHVSAIFDKLGLPPNAEDHRRVLAVLAYLKG